MRKWLINANKNYSTQVRNGITDSFMDGFIFCSGYSYLAMLKAVYLNCTANKLLVHHLYEQYINI